MNINAQKMQKLLNSVLTDYTMIGYHFEAIDSITRYPDLYQNGKRDARLLFDVVCDLEPEPEYDPDLEYDHHVESGLIERELNDSNK